MAVPIWKDYYKESPWLVGFWFRILVGGYNGTVIYTGKALTKPGERLAKVRINDICADYLRATVPDFDLRFTAGLLELTFYIQAHPLGDTAWYNQGSVTFTNDWSYDYNYVASRDGYSFPISQVADPRQILLLTVPAGTTQVNAVILNSGGDTTTVVLPVTRTADFNNDYNGDYSHLSDAAQAGVVQLDLGLYPSAVRVVMGGITWTVDRANCRRYGIYYVNAYGGWDSIAVHGYQVDAYKRHDYATDYDNTKQSAIGRVDFLNEVDMRFALQTGMLTELGASRMHNLVGTNAAVIHEFGSNRILPVTIVTDSVKYKTYRSEGRTPISYELEVAVAQDRQRR